MHPSRLLRPHVLLASAVAFAAMFARPAGAQELTCKQEFDLYTKTASLAVAYDAKRSDALWREIADDYTKASDTPALTSCDPSVFRAWQYADALYHVLGMENGALQKSREHLDRALAGMNLFSQQKPEMSNDEHALMIRLYTLVQGWYQEEKLRPNDDLLGEVARNLSIAGIKP